jgi:hypothetical protein
LDLLFLAVRAPLVSRARGINPAARRGIVNYINLLHDKLATLDQAITLIMIHRMIPKAKMMRIAMNITLILFLPNKLKYPLTISEQPSRKKGGKEGSQNHLC